MDWRIKGAIQKVLGVLPGGDDLHYQLQRRAGGLRFLDKEIRTKIEDWRLMAGHLKNAGFPIKGTRFVEMGTGWYPTFPFLLYLGGAAQVDTLDLNRYLRHDLTVECARKIGEQLDVVAAAVDEKVETVRATHAELTRCLARGDDPTDATGGVVRYRAPADATDTKLPADSVDVMFSNSVLEHVPGDVIAACLTEAKRILRPRGVVFHSVNCGDHYAYADDRISQLNYLQFSNDDWNRWNNRFLYQNRLRAIDFTDMARAAGFAIELDTSRPHPRRLAELAQIEVHRDFARYSRDQLAITSIDFIGRK